MNWNSYWMPTWLREPFIRARRWWWARKDRNAAYRSHRAAVREWSDDRARRAADVAASGCDQRQLAKEGEER